MSDGRLPLILLGGALGSGKTTWARHQLHVGAFGSGVHVLVNEAAEVAVDDQLLTGAAGVTVLAGGCACCDGRAALVAALRGVCDQRSRGLGPERVLLETSGLADPGAIATALRGDPVLAHHLRLEEIIVAVDAVHAFDQLRDEALVHRQILVADRLVLTKADAVDPAQLARLHAGLARRNGAAGIEAAGFGVTLPLGPAGEGDLPGLPEEWEPSVTAVLAVPEGLDWAEVMVWLSALLHARGDRIVRVKGVLATPAGRLLVQAVRAVVQPPEVLPDVPSEGDGRLVFLGRGFSGDLLKRSLRGFLGLV